MFAPVVEPVLPVDPLAILLDRLIASPKALTSPFRTRLYNDKARPANTVSLLPVNVPKCVRTPAVLPSSADLVKFAPAIISLVVNPPTLTSPKPNKFCASVFPASAVTAPNGLSWSIACPTRSAVLTFCIPGISPVAPIAAPVQSPLLAASRALYPATNGAIPGINDRPILSKSASLNVELLVRCNTAPSDLRTKSAYPGTDEGRQLAYSSGSWDIWVSISSPSMTLLTLPPVGAVADFVYPPVDVMLSAGGLTRFKKSSSVVPAPDIMLSVNV